MADNGTPQNNHGLGIGIPYGVHDNSGDKIEIHKVHKGGACESMLANVSLDLLPQQHHHVLSNYVEEHHTNST